MLVFWGLVHLAGAGSASAYTAENVFLVFLGGVRNSEAFEDPTHQFIPFLWDSLAPQGTVYESFYNLCATGMKSGGSQAVCGLREFLASRHDTLHGVYPTIFEYFRKDLARSKEDAWFISNNDNNSTGLNFSLHPAYGSVYRAGREIDPGPDSSLLPVLFSIMALHHPRIIVIGFNDIDQAAQEEGVPVDTCWARYTRAIRAADSLTYRIWLEIEGDTIYQGRTALFVLSEHGRHDDAHGGFRWHGDACNGCRRLPFLALGPDFKAGATVSQTGDLIDLAPTIGQLLGFDPIFARGRGLEELFSTPMGERLRYRGGCSPEAGTAPSEVRLSSGSGRSLFPSIGSDRRGLHVSWVEEDTTDPARVWDVPIVTSLDGGTTWSAITTVFRSNGDTMYYHSTADCGDSVGTIIAASGYRLTSYPDPYQALTWGFSLRRSEDDSVWFSAQPVLVEREEATDSRPSVSIQGPNAVALYPTIGYSDQPWRRYVFRSTDGGVGWAEEVMSTPHREAEFPLGPDVAVLEDTLYFVEAVRPPVSGGWVFAARETSSTWSDPVRIDRSGDESLFPAVVVGNTIVHVVWADNGTGWWEILYSRSTDGTASWSAPVVLSESGVAAWQPDVVCHGDSLVVAWEDYRDGSAEIYLRMSSDGGASWGVCQRISQDSSMSVHPRVTLAAGGSVGSVWQNLNHGNWDICFRSVPFEVVGVTQPGGLASPAPSAFQLGAFPNPFSDAITITFTHPSSVRYEWVAVHNILGQRIWKSERMPTGGQLTRWKWKGSDSRGRVVCPGVYFVVGGGTTASGAKVISRALRVIVAR
jgi:hypothetical protein